MENSLSRASEAPDEEACRVQLRRILASPAFDATERDRRFLAYVVEESLAGRADRIKAYTIALEVFERDASFDPQTDPIVRVEAGHLRRALDRYYLSSGRGDPVVIGVPKGGYAPIFEARPPPAEPGPSDPVPGQRSGWRRRGVAVVAGLTALAFLLGAGASGLLLRREVPMVPDVPRLAVTPFKILSGDGGASAFAAGLTSELVAEVARFRDIVVASPEGAGGPAPRYLLEGDVAGDASDLRAQLRLRRSEDDSVIWAESYRADLGSEPRLAAEARIGSLAATAIGQPYGAIFQADMAARAGQSWEAGDAYACTLGYFDFRATADDSGYRSVRSCLEAAVARFPDYATAWALLAQIHLDGQRWGLASDVPIERALDEARRALILDPTNVRGLQAKMMALYLAGDIEGALRAGATAVATNPNDTEVLGEYGYRLAVSGRWAEGCASMQEATERNPGPLPYYETGIALCAYIDGRYDEAAARIRAAPFPQVPIYHVMAAALFAEAGQREDARRERDWLVANAPGVLRNLPALIASRLGRPEDQRKALASLRRAGIAQAVEGEGVAVKGSD